MLFGFTQPTMDWSITNGTTSDRKSPRHLITSHITSRFNKYPTRQLYSPPSVVPSLRMREPPQVTQCNGIYKKAWPRRKGKKNKRSVVISIPIPSQGGFQVGSVFPFNKPKATSPVMLCPPDIPSIHSSHPPKSSLRDYTQISSLPPHLI